MLSNEAMGILALAILWVNTLLITAAAGKELFSLLALKRRMKSLGTGDTGVGLIEGRVERADGPDGALACQKVEQTGRQASARGDRRMIVFADRSQKGEIFGGAVRKLHGPAVEVEVQGAVPADVWLPGDALKAAGACPSTDIFDAAYEDARKARGYARTVTAAIGTGATVWVMGTLERNGTKLRMVPAIVASLDPRAFCNQKIAQSALFIAAVPAIAAGCTAVALHPPVFGTVSTAGGALCLVFFLLAQPAGTALRNAVKAPSQSEVRGRWARDESVQSGGPG
jgi:hypothetical protein